MDSCQEDVLRAVLGDDWRRELVAHHIDSFDDFVANRISDVVEGFNPIGVRHEWTDGDASFSLSATIVVERPKLERPSAAEHDGTVHAMTPDVARSRHFTYAGATPSTFVRVVSPGACLIATCKVA